MGHCSVTELARPNFSNIIDESYQRPSFALKQIKVALGQIESENQVLILHLLAAQLNLDFEQFEAAEQHLEILENRVDPWLEAEYYVHFTFQQIRLDLKMERELEALISLHHLLAFLKNNKSKKHLSQTYLYLGDVMRALERYSEALRYLKLAESQFAQSGDRDLMVAIFRKLSSVYTLTKDYQQSQSYLSKAEKVITFSRVGIDVGLMFQRACLGLHLGQREAVDDIVRKLLARHETSPDPLVKKLIRKGLAKVFYRQEEFDKAASFQQLYLSSFTEQSAPYYSAMEFLAIIRARQGQEIASRQLLEQSQNYFLAQPKAKGRNAQIAARARAVYTGILENNQEVEALRKMLEQQVVLAHSQLGEAKAEAASNIQDLFKTLNEKHEIELLNKSNTEKKLLLSKDAMEYQIFIVLVFALILVMAVGLLWRSTIAKRDLKIGRLVSELDEMSVRDSLTMLHNRRYFKNTADTLIANCQRRFEKAENNESFLGFIMLDIDNLGRLNQYYSHELGDYVLKQVAEDLREDCREGDILIRWGGEEFLILVNDTNFERLQKFCRRILNERNQKELKFQETKHQVTCSMGYVLFPFDGELNTQFTWEDIIKIADHCLRIAKAEGRNRAYGLEALSMSPEAKYLLFTDFDACIDQEYVKLHKIEGTVAL